MIGCLGDLDVLGWREEFLRLVGVEWEMMIVCVMCGECCMMHGG